MAHQIFDDGVDIYAGSGQHIGQRHQLPKTIVARDQITIAIEGAEALNKMFEGDARQIGLCVDYTFLFTALLAHHVRDVRVQDRQPPALGLPFGNLQPAVRFH